MLVNKAWHLKQELGTQGWCKTIHWNAERPFYNFRLHFSSQFNSKNIVNHLLVFDIQIENGVADILDSPASLLVDEGS